mmetsp:Transcript_10767/g.18343  ORF Transcript_10767/g.18343 Transcript_10767/m.18343 type:complete len:292 (-) Transcript_10767:782-1657(-)
MVTFLSISCLLALLLCLFDSSEALLTPSSAQQNMSRVGNRHHHPYISTRHVSKTTPSNHISRREGKRSHHQSSTSLAAADERKPWELFRFISQSSKFVTLPPLPFAAKNPVKRKVGVGETIWEAGNPNNFFNFAPLDDVVMGGASNSNIDNNTGTWSGKVTDANNGGFVGVRSTPFQGGSLSLDMSQCKGIEIRFRRGNGKRFKFVVRDSTEFNGICWTTSFDAKANGSVRIPFSSQVPTVFAKTVSGASFNVDEVVGLQFAYSKFEYDGKLNNNFDVGDFALQIVELKTY